ncbi:MAG TPA: argininosuccinate lyase [Bdellovibrionota bacterium]|nr:argininosuccinate lyase [Bdellovibrionota bacterium]
MKLWGGRFDKETHREVEEFSASIGVDARLWEADIRGSIAHAKMLGRVDVLKPDEAKAIVEGLGKVRESFVSGVVKISPTAEDIHSEIERLLGEEIGPVAGKLHTGRSRNDQVATATRLYLRERIGEFGKSLRELQALLLERAGKLENVILPGFTHLQHAQPVSLAHHLLAYFWMFQRDRERLVDCAKRVNQLPLGSAALAGTTFPLDREWVAGELGFAGLCENSLDAVSDRDFVVEFLSAASLVMTHLSRICEELILWSTPEFGFVRLDDSVTTGSSIMPQKKNPDVAELIRGRTGKVQGALVAVITMLKGLPLSYNRDLQEDKEQLFNGLDTAHSSVRLMKLMLESAEFSAERMAASLSGDLSNATDLADHLVRRGLPFRQAHEVVGRIVKHCLSEGVKLEEMALGDFQKFSPLFEASVVAEVKPDSVRSARNSRGGTGSLAVREQMALARKALG